MQQGTNKVTGWRAKKFTGLLHLSPSTGQYFKYCRERNTCVDLNPLAGCLDSPGCLCALGVHLRGLGSLGKAPWNPEGGPPCDPLNGS